jgi:hypothetical protein
MVKYTEKCGDHETIYEASTIPELVELFGRFNINDEEVHDTNPKCMVHVTGMTRKQLKKGLKEIFRRIPKGMVIF